MTLPRSILYPVDFSALSGQVWPAVASMAHQLEASVTLLHAVDLDYLELPEEFSETRRIRQRIFDKLEAFATPGVQSVKREVSSGSPAHAIVRFAGTMDQPLVMMPTRGHTRFRQLLLGSTTAAVLHDAECPVWTDAHTDKIQAFSGKINIIVCALDLGPQTPAVLQSALAFSQKFGAALKLVHSVPGIDPHFPSATADRAHAFLKDQALELFPEHCRKAGIDLPLEIVEDVGLVNGIAASAARHNADLLVIGRGVCQGTLGRLRTNAHALIRHSPCPVLSV